MPPKKTEKPARLSLDATLADLRKRYGPGAVMLLGDGNGLPPVEVIPSGSIALDEALGVGGYPRGRIIEAYGPESGGKTSMALHAVAQAQLRGDICAFIDAEHAFDTEWAAALGVDTDALYVSQPDSGEQALEICDGLAKSRRFGFICIDSVAALVPQAEIDGEMGQSHIGLQARMMSQALRKLTALCSPETEDNFPGTTVFFINQLREKVGVLFGSPEITTGGKALKFYASIRLDVRRISTLKDGTEPVGSRVRVKVVKNKVARPFGIAEFDFIFGEGVSHEGELIDLGVERAVLIRSGARYTFPAIPPGTGETVLLGNGKEAARRYLREHPDIAATVEQAVRAHRGTGRPVPAKAAAEVEMDGPGPWDGGGG